MRGSTTDEFEAFLADHAPIRQSAFFVEGECVGEWRITAFLGKGGSGEVYRAENVRDHTLVALKIHVPRPGKSDSQENAARQRFAREARILSENTYPFFPRFYGSGEARGFLYFAIELLENITLPSTDAAIAAFLLKISAAVRVLHLHGLVHRDIKPQNIMRRANGDLVLIDLGLVKEFSASASPSGTSATLVDGKVVGVGTPHYAAPEQFNGGAVSPATDIHALGLLANECFGGRPPRAWERIISRSTSSIPERRYGGVDAFEKAVRYRHLRGLAFWCGLPLAILFVPLWLLAGHRSGAEEAQVVSGEDDHVAPVVPAAPTADAAPAAPAANAANAANTTNTANAASTDNEGDADDADDVATTVETASELRQCIASAKSGDVIAVKPGRYVGAISWSGKALKLVALSKDPRATVLVGEKGKSVIRIDRGCDGTLIRGFTLTGGTGTPQPSSYGHDYFGGGIHASSSATVENCIIRGNGKGEAQKDAATFGGGVWTDANAVVRLVNCLIADNFAWACGGAAGTGDGELHFERCTIADNRSTTFFGHQGGVGLARGGKAFVWHSILWGNSGDQLGAFAGPYSRDTIADIEDSVIEGGSAPCGIQKFASGRCRSGDPLFADHDVYLPTAASFPDTGFHIR